MDISADDAAQRGLPPIAISIDTAGTPMSISVFPPDGYYVRVSGPPGGVVMLDIAPTSAESVEDALRAQVAGSEISERGIVLFGRPHEAAVIHEQRHGGSIAIAGVLVRTANQAVLVRAKLGAGQRQLGLGDIVTHVDLAKVLRSIAIGGETPGPKSVDIAAWNDRYAERVNLRRALGALFGLAVGDALGTTHEFQTLEAPAFPELATGPLTDIVGGGPFNLAPGQVTDDTQMAAALSDALLKSKKLTPGLVIPRYLDWRRAAFDIGVQINTALDAFGRSTPPEYCGRAVWENRARRPAGNGSLMRTAVAGVMLATLPAETRRMATFLDGAVTHFDPRCQLACAVYNAAIAFALTERPNPASMVRAAERELPEAAAALRALHPELHAEIAAAEAVIASDIAAAHDDDPRLYTDELHLHRTSGFVRVALRLAFWHLAHAPDFASAVIDAANRGGDADTNAAITGALLGAFYGIDQIPRAWVDRVLAATPVAHGDLEFGVRTLVRPVVRAAGKKTVEEMLSS